MPDSNLKQKRKAFCCNYVMLGNVEEAAVKAGFEKRLSCRELLVWNLQSAENLSQSSELILLTAEMFLPDLNVLRLETAAMRFISFSPTSSHLQA